MTPPVTLKQLAELLKLAPSTVSRALKGHPDISAETQAKVKALALQLHYRPNAMALSLRNRRSYLLAVIVPELTNFFYTTVLKGIIRHAYANSYKVVVFESEEQYKHEVDICHFLQKSGIDGLLLAPAQTTWEAEHLKQLQVECVPLIFFDRMVGNIDIGRIMADDYDGAYVAVKYMIDGGCRRIAHLAASQQWIWAQKREMGYVQALLDYHLPVDRELIIEYRDLTEIPEIVERLVKNSQIDGIFAVDDSSAVEALSVIHQLGYRIPQDIAICGFGNDPVAAVACPSLTTVDRNGEQMGEMAAEFLINRIEGKISGETESKLLKDKLIVRSSTLSLGINVNN